MKLAAHRRILTFSDMDFYTGVIGRQVADYSPEFVVSIRCGGWYVGKVLSSLMGINHLSITVRRTDDSVNEQVSAGIAICRAFAELFWRPWVMPYVVARLSPSVGIRINGKRVLLVDDAVHSGDTMKVAVEYLASFNPECIMTAAVGNVHTRSIVDHWVLDGWYCYPWSKVSPYYAQFRAMMDHEAIEDVSSK